MKTSICRSLCHSFNSVNMRHVVKVSSDNWTNLAHLMQTIKTIQKNICSNHFLYLNFIKFPKCQNFFIFQDLIYKIKIQKKIVL